MANTFASAGLDAATGDAAKAIAGALRSQARAQLLAVLQPVLDDIVGRAVDALTQDLRVRFGQHHDPMTFGTQIQVAVDGALRGERRAADLVAQQQRAGA